MAQAVLTYTQSPHSPVYTHLHPVASLFPEVGRHSWTRSGFDVTGFLVPGTTHRVYLEHVYNEEESYKDCVHTLPGG